MGSTTGTTLTGIIQFFVQATDGTTYCFGSTGSVFARSGDGAWNFTYNDENGAIRGAAEWKLSDGNNYLYWATATSVARKLLGGAEIVPDTGTQRWTDVTADFKTTLDVADWHTMKQASGSLMIANGNYLASIAFDGSFNNAALNIRPGNLIKALEERDDYVILGSTKGDQSEEGHIWSWITTATNWVQKKRVPIKGVNALINTELMLLQGGNDGELFFSDFVNSVPIQSVPGGGQTDPSGVSIEDDLAVFGFYGGTYPGIWSYGRRHKNRPQVLNFDYRLAKTVAGSSISTIAAVAVVDGTLLASWGTTDGSVSEYGVDSVSSTTKATALYEGLEFDNGATHLKKEFNSVKLVMLPLPTGTSVSVKFKIDKATTGGDSSAGDGWKYAVTGSGATTFSQTDATEVVFSTGVTANIYEVGVELNPSANTTPEILAITSYLSESKFEYA